MGADAELMAQYVTDNGKTINARCRCPSCRHPVTKVLRTGTMEDGVLVRLRLCLSCDRRWFTAQDPEYLVRSEAVVWRRDRPLLKP